MPYISSIPYRKTPPKRAGGVGSRLRRRVHVVTSATTLGPVAGPVFFVEPPRVGEVTFEGGDVGLGRLRPVTIMVLVGNLADAESGRVTLVRSFLDVTAHQERPVFTVLLERGLATTYPDHYGNVREVFPNPPFDVLRINLWVIRRHRVVCLQLLAQFMDRVVARAQPS